MQIRPADHRGSRIGVAVDRLWAQFETFWENYRGLPIDYQFLLIMGIVSDLIMNSQKVRNMVLLALVAFGVGGVFMWQDQNPLVVVEALVLGVIIGVIWMWIAVVFREPPRKK